MLYSAPGSMSVLTVVLLIVVVVCNARNTGILFHFVLAKSLLSNNADEELEEASEATRQHSLLRIIRNMRSYMHLPQ